MEEEFCYMIRRRDSCIIHVYYTGNKIQKDSQVFDIEGSSQCENEKKNFVCVPWRTRFGIDASDAIVTLIFPKITY